jgi:cellulose biosynthesis protein BcsQ
MGSYDTKTVLVANQKGGVGKTWISDELCFMCDKNDVPYTFRDYDLQGGSNHEPIENEDPALIIIDTPGALQENLYEWIKKADLIIVPTLMTKACVEPLIRMMEILKPWKSMGKEVIVIHNQWNRFTACADFEEWYFETFPDQRTITLSESEVVRQAINAGVSVTDYKKHSKSALEIVLFFKMIMDILYNRRRF